MIVTLESRSFNELVVKLFYNKFIKANKPCNIYIIGGSGEGKSYFSLKVAEILMKHLNNYDIKHLCEHHIIYNYFDFQNVVAHVFGDDCNLPLLLMQESSLLIHARKFMTLQNLAVAKVMSLARAIKPTLNLFLSQSYMDIDIAIRRRLNFIALIKRYVLSNGTSLKPYAKILHVAHELNKQSLEPITIHTKSGFEILDKITFSKPSKQLVELFENLDKQKKMIEIIEQESEEEKNFEKILTEITL